MTTAVLDQTTTTTGRRHAAAARIPLTEIQRAVELAESRTVVGKVILIP